MSFESFFTQQIIPGASPQVGAVAAGPPKVGSAPQNALQFLQLVTQQLQGQKNPENPENPDQQNIPQNELLQSDNPLLSKQPKLDIAKLLASSPDIEEDAEEIAQLIGGADGENLIDVISQVLSLNQEAFDAIVKPLVTDKFSVEESLQKTGSISIYDLVIEDSADILVIENENSVAPELLKDILVQLKDLKDAGQLKFDNLSPEQTVLIERVIDGEEFDFEAGTAPNVVVFELIKALLPNAQIGVLQAQPSHGVSDAAQVVRDVIAKQNRNNAGQSLNSIAPGEGGALSDVEFDELLQKISSKDVLKNIKLGNGESISIKLQAGGTENAHVLPILSPNLGFDSILAGLNSFDLLAPAEGSFSSAAGTSPLSGLQTLSSSLSQSHSAGQASPATQMVALTMQKSAMDGANKSLTLQLDPPELGRVEVKMSFSKDKTMKALLTIEKPETLAMLQRDTHTLEKAMNDIGLDAEGGVDLQLSQDNQDFGQDGRHDGSRNQANAGGGDDDAEETVMLNIQRHGLYFDPETGLMRCDVLA